MKLLVLTAFIKFQNRFLRALSCVNPRTMKERNQEAMESSLSLSQQSEHVKKHIDLMLDVGQTW